MKQLTIIVLALVTIELNAEMIDGPANVRDKIKGDVIFELYDSVVVYAGEMNENWYKIEVMAIIDNDAIDSDGRVKPNVMLTDYYRNNPIIGKTKGYVNTADYFSHNGKMVVLIEGFTFKGNIRPETIVERDIELIFKTKGQLNKTILSDHLKVYNYTKITDLDSYELIMAYDLKPESPLMRCGFVFDKSGIVVAIITNDRKVGLNFIVTKNLLHGYKLNIISKTDYDLQGNLNSFLSTTN